MIKNKKLKKKNKRGFTLIELLAVIIILGVVLIIAIPTVSKYIEDSRRKTYVNSIQSIVSAISTSVNNLEYPLPKKDEGIIIPFSEAELEKGNKTKSPYATYAEGKSYVVVVNDGQSYDYYVATLDEAGFSIPLISSKQLTAQSITSNATTISNNVYSIGEITDNANRNKIFETSQFAMKYLSKTGDIVKVKIGESIYQPGDIIQLKDGSKWYALPSSFDSSGNIVNDDIDVKTINLLSYYNMYTQVQEEYGKQSGSKTTQTLVFDNNGIYTYENAQIYGITSQIVTKAKTVLNRQNINTIGATIDMVSMSDFCGPSNTSSTFRKYYTKCKGLVSNLNLSTDDNFWTKDNYDGDEQIITIKSGEIMTAGYNSGINQGDTSYGIRLVIRQLLKSNIDKTATKALN